MSDNKITHISDKPILAPEEPDEEVVSRLEEALARAKDGSLKNMIIIADLNGVASYTICGHSFGFQHLGALCRATADLAKHV